MHMRMIKTRIKYQIIIDTSFFMNFSTTLGFLAYGDPKIYHIATYHERNANKKV